MKKILLTSLVFLIFHGAYLPAFGMEERVSEFSDFKKRAKESNTKILDLVGEIKMSSDSTEGRCIIFRVLSDESSDLRGRKYDPSILSSISTESEKLDILKSLLKRTEELKEKSSSLLHLTIEEYQKNNESQKDFLASIDQSRLEIYTKFSEFEYRNSIERRRLVLGEESEESEERELLMRGRESVDPLSEASAEELIEVVDCCMNRGEDILPLCERKPCERKPLDALSVVVLNFQGLQRTDFPGLKIIGSRFVEPDQPFFAEMFLKFHSEDTRFRLKEYKDRNDVASQNLLKNGVFTKELILNDRFLRILNRIENAFYDGSPTVFTAVKTPEKTEFFKYFVSFYKVFFSKRTFFLKELLSNPGNDSLKQKIVLLKLEKSEEENKQIKEMAAFFRNLSKVLGDIKEEYLTLDIPCDLRSSLGVWKRKQCLSDPSDEKIIKDALGDDYLSMKDYLRQIEQKLLDFTFVEKKELFDFFEPV